MELKEKLRILSDAAKYYVSCASNAEMILRFADVLGVTTDELLRGEKNAPAAKKQPSLKLIRRMEQIESLPPYQQRALLTTIDAFLKNVENPAS